MAGGKLADIVQGYKTVRDYTQAQKPAAPVTAAPSKPAPMDGPGMVGGKPHMNLPMTPDHPKRDLPRRAQVGDSTMSSTRAVRGRR